VADRYIDNGEISEYGRYFWEEAARLLGLSTVVDIAVLRQLVLAQVEAMEAKLGQARAQQNGARIERSSTSEATVDLNDWLHRLFYHLKTVPADAAIDHEAFFPNGTLDRIERLKPADLLDRSAAVLVGFSSPRNATLPGAAEWQAGIAGARTALQEAISGKRGSRSDTKDAVSSMAETRQRFLNVYNNMAKRLVHAVLAEIGRLDEYRRFFLDLQVNEDGSRAEPAQPPAQPGDQPGTEPTPPAASPETLPEALPRL
jgi:hypothetical protein